MRLLRLHPVPPVSRLSARLGALFLLVLLPSLSAAQPPVFVDQIGPLEPFNESGHPKAIGGTQFPWFDRFGRFVCTLGGRFTVINAQNLNGFSVTINGQPCTLTGTPSTAHWSYPEQSNPIPVGPGPGVATFTLAIYYNGQLARTTGVQNPYTYQVWVYQVLPVTVDGPNDVVNTTNNLYFIPGPPDKLSTSPADSYARKIQNSFKVTGPSQCNGDLGGVTVGIIQTLTDETFGDINYTNANNPAITGTLHRMLANPLFPPPWWDGNPNGWPCYYDTTAARIFSYGHSTQDGNGNWVWNGLTDTPQIILADRPYQGATYVWGIQNSGLRYLLWGLNPPPSRADSFEDMLTGSVQSCPNVVVPIYGYLDWQDTFKGYLTISNGIWTGGSVTSNGTHPSTQPVADTNLGPPEKWVTSNFTVP
jgi:hypothetical protein